MLPSFIILLALLLIVEPVLGRKKGKLSVLDFAVTPVFDVGKAPEALAVGDFDGDHNLDLIVANAGSKNLSVLTGDNRGKLRLTQTIDGVFGGLLTGDFNRDGRPDLLVVDGDKDQLQVFLNEGGLQMRPQTAIPVGGTIPSTINKTAALGDFNGDNLLDVAAIMITPEGRWELFLAFGTGDGQFSNQLTVQLNQPPIAMVALDANEDGITDLAIADVKGITLVLGNRQTGAIVAQDQFEEIRGRLIASADFNLDGHSDIAVISDEGPFWLLSGNGRGQFTITQTGREHGPFSAVVAGDFDGDGQTDIALIRMLGDVALLRTVGGSFSAANYFTLSGTNTLAAITADLNTDGRADLIAANTDTDTISVLYGRTDGFASARHYVMDQPIAQIVSNDFNGDGKLDLALTEESANANVSMLSGNGHGEFTQESSLLALPFPGGFTSADLDGDGRPDFIFSSSNTDKIGLVFSGSGLAAEPMLTFATGNQRGGPGDIVVGDFDGDGLRDIAVANSNAIGGTRNITIFFGFRGDGFTRIENIELGAVPRNLVAGDFNGDGITDLATETCCPHESLLLLLGVRNGTPQPQELPLPGRSYSGLAAADFNHDGITDLAFTDPVKQEVVMLTLGRDAQPANISQIPISLPYLLQAADIDNDGKIDLIVLGQKFATILLGSGDGHFRLGPAICTSVAVQLVVADFNQDGKNDLIIVGRDYIEPIISQ